ncbi:hypothetical protein JCM11641_004145 [Rhodosporidiobolus odoratus]
MTSPAPPFPRAGPSSAHLAPPPPPPAHQATPSNHPRHPLKSHQSHAACRSTDHQLQHELPTVNQDLVPLSYLIDRTVQSAYSDLAILVETLPSQNDQARKRAIVDYVLHTRRQLLKLLVLARWSTEADRIAKGMNIIGFLSQQNNAVEASIAHLSETNTILMGARARNYDLSTAISVLSHGDYPALPSSIREAFQGQEQFDDDQVLGTMRDVDEVIRWRLVMGLESLPTGLTRAPYTIADGRVTFTVPNLWEASFTYGGDNEAEDAEWYLLGVQFLFRVKDARGAWSSTPLGPLKDHLIELCNRELLRRPFLPASPLPADQQPPVPPPPAPTEDATGAERAEGQEETQEERENKYEKEKEEAVRKRKRDRPLNRGYTFLQRLALSYQLEAIYAQAARLATTSWSGSLKVEMGGKERDEVRVEYWSYKPDPPQQSSSAKSSQRPPPAPASIGGALVFSLRPSTPAPPPPAPSDKPPRAAAPAASSSTVRPVLSPAPSAATTRAAAREAALQAALSAASSSSSSSAPPSLSTDNSAVDDLPSTSSSDPALEAPSASSSSALDPSSTEPPDLPLSLSITWLPTPNSLLPATHSTLSPSLLLDQDLDIEILLRRVTEAQARDTVQILWGVVGDEGGVRVVYPGLGGGSGTGSGAVRGRERRSRKRGHEKEEGMVRMEVDVLDDDDEEAENGSEKQEGEEDEEEGVPYLYFPLPPSHALAAHIVPQTGRFELRPTSLLVSPATASSTSSSATASAAAAPPTALSTAAETRMRLATERVEKDRYFPPVGPPGKESGEEVRSRVWMKAVRDVVERIRTNTILDDLDSLASILSLPNPIRRLALPAREFPKFGAPFTSPSALPSGRNGFSFMPLSHRPPSQSHAQGENGDRANAEERKQDQAARKQEFYLALVVVEEEGVRPALIRTREVRDLGSTSSWVEILEVGWVGIPPPSSSSSSSAVASDQGKGKGKNCALPPPAPPYPPPPFSQPFTNHRPPALSVEEIKTETLFQIWRYAAHRAALFRVQEQLVERRVPFRVVPSSSSSSSTGDAAGEGEGDGALEAATGAAGGDGREYLVLPTEALVQLPPSPRTTLGGGGGGKGTKERGGVAYPNAALQCQLDAEGVVRTTLHVRFRFPPSPFLSPSDEPEVEAGAGSAAAPTGRPDPKKLPPGVLYNPGRDVVVFVVQGEVEGCVEKLLRAYASTARTVHLAQQAYSKKQQLQLQPQPSHPTPPSKPSVSASASSSSTVAALAPPPLTHPTSPSKKSPLKIVNKIGVKPFG